MEYINETELRSYIIRFNNKGMDYNEKDLIKINKYIKRMKTKNQRTKRIMRKYITLISERNGIDPKSYEAFGAMLILIIKNMMKKPNFSGYTYRDDFYSETNYKILKYIKNFNHKLISERSGQAVNAFAYVSQIVKNSFIFIIEQKKTENEKLKNMVSLESHEKLENVNESTYEYFKQPNKVTIEINSLTSKSETPLFDEINAQLKLTNSEVIFIYPEDYRISLEEYEKIIELNKIYNRNIIIRRKI